MSLSADKMLPFAIALAEAVRNRTLRLNQLKDVRHHQQSETAEQLAITTGAFRSSKRMMREALKSYNAARAKVYAGNEPGQLDEDTIARLKMYGWNL